jgi:hypothetical protein
MIALRKKHLPVVVTVLLAAFTCSQTAFATTFFVPDEDTTALVALLQNGIQTLAVMNQQLDTVKNSYQEIHKTAQLAADAVNVVQGVLNLNPDQVLHSIEAAFPDVQYFEMQARYPNSWTQGSGSLQAMTQICVSSAAHSAPGTTDFPLCAMLEGSLDLVATKKLFATTYGVARQRELEASGQESARTLAAAHAAVQRHRAVDAQAKALMQQCTSTSTPAACQAAATAAAVMQLEQTADTSDQMALIARMEAIQVAQANGQVRRDDTDAAWREEQLRKSVQSLGAPPMTLKTDGFSVIGDLP